VFSFRTMVLSQVRVGGPAWFASVSRLLHIQTPTLNYLYQDDTLEARSLAISSFSA
jgi:hypothetical protein